MAGFSPHNYMDPNAGYRYVQNSNGSVDYYLFTPTKTQDMGWGAIGTGGTVQKLTPEEIQTNRLNMNNTFRAVIDPDTWSRNGRYTPDEIRSNIQQTFSGFDKDNKTGWQSKVDDLVKQATDLYNQDPNRRDKVFGDVWNKFRYDPANAGGIQAVQAGNNPPRPEFTSQEQANTYAQTGQLMDPQQLEEYARNGGNVPTTGQGGAPASGTGVAPAAGGAPATPPPIPFKSGLSEAQKTSITNLMNRTTPFNETDAKNYGFATGTDYKQHVGKTPQQILTALAASGGGQNAGGKQPTPLTDPSIENFLVAVGLPSDIAARTRMAQERGITGYRGTADQNTRLLTMLRQEYAAGTLGKPVDPNALPKSNGAGPEQKQAANPQEEIDRINAEANSLQDDEFNLIEQNAGQKVDISQSAQLTEKLIKMLEGKQEQDKKAPSMEQKFLDERQKLGVGQLETTLAGLDAKLKQLDADYASAIEGEEGRLVSMSQVQRRQSAEGVAYQRARRDLVAERDSIANQLNTKYGVIKSIMDVAGMDYDNAQQNYQTQFNQSLQMINLVKGIENEAKDDKEKAVDNARANATIMYNLLKEGNVKYESLDASAKADIKNLEIQAGLPAGFMEFITSAIDEPLIHFGTAFTDAKGDRIQPVLTVDKTTGNVNTKNIPLGKVKTGNNNNNTLNPNNKNPEIDALAKAYNKGESLGSIGASKKAQVLVRAEEMKREEAIASRPKTVEAVNKIIQQAKEDGYSDQEIIDSFVEDFGFTKDAAYKMITPLINKK